MRFHRYVRALLKGGPKAWVHELGETLKDRFATEGDRKRAIELLSFLPAKVAVPQLMKRFELVVESGMHERQEKEQVARLLAGEGPAVVPEVLRYVREAPRISWPILVLEQLLPRREFVTVLLGLLSPVYPEFEASVIARNHDIIVGLTGVDDERIPEALLPHEDCRYPEIRAAVEECFRYLESRALT